MAEGSAFLVTVAQRELGRNAAAQQKSHAQIQQLLEEIQLTGDSAQRLYRAQQHVDRRIETIVNAKATYYGAVDMLAKVRARYEAKVKALNESLSGSNENYDLCSTALHDTDASLQQKHTRWVVIDAEAQGREKICANARKHFKAVEKRLADTRLKHGGQTRSLQDAETAKQAAEAAKVALEKQIETVETECGRLQEDCLLAADREKDMEQRVQSAEVKLTTATVHDEKTKAENQAYAAQFEELKKQAKAVTDLQAKLQELNLVNENGRANQDVKEERTTEITAEIANLRTETDRFRAQAAPLETQLDEAKLKSRATKDRQAIELKRLQITLERVTALTKGLDPITFQKTVDTVEAKQKRLSEEEAKLQSEQQKLVEDLRADASEVEERKQKIRAQIEEFKSEGEKRESIKKSRLIDLSHWPQATIRLNEDHQNNVEEHIKLNAELATKSVATLDNLLQRVEDDTARMEAANAIKRDCSAKLKALLEASREGKRESPKRSPTTQFQERPQPRPQPTSPQRIGPATPPVPATPEVSNWQTEAPALPRPVAAHDVAAAAAAATASAARTSVFDISPVPPTPEAASSQVTTAPSSIRTKRRLSKATPRTSSVISEAKPDNPEVLPIPAAPASDASSDLAPADEPAHPKPAKKQRRSPLVAPSAPAATGQKGAGKTPKKRKPAEQPAPERASKKTARQSPPPPTPAVVEPVAVPVVPRSVPLPIPIAAPIVAPSPAPSPAPKEPKGARPKAKPKPKATPTESKAKPTASAPPPKPSAPAPAPSATPAPAATPKPKAVRAQTKTKPKAEPVVVAPSVQPRKPSPTPSTVSTTMPTSKRRARRSPGSKARTNSVTGPSAIVDFSESARSPDGGQPDPFMFG